MAKVFYILKEECDRQEKLKIIYEKEISSLPSGGIYPRKRGKHIYYYFGQYDPQIKNVFYKYIGTDSEKIKELEIKIEKRKKLQKLLKDVKNEIKEIQKVLHGKLSTA